VIALSDEFRGLAEQVQKMNKHLEEQSEKFVTLNAHIEQQSKKFTTLKNRVAGYKTEIETLGKNYDAAQTAVGQLNQTNTALLTNFTNSFVKMEQIIQTLTDKTTIETKAREQLQEKVAKDQIEMQQKLQVSIDAVTTAMQNQTQAQNPQDAEEMIRKEKERVEAFKRLQEEYGKFTKKEFEASDTLDTRSRILSVAIARYKDQTGDRKLPFFEGMSLYLEEGGTKAEYLAQFLTTTREELKVFGVEVASVRKFMYGFLPPGTFRLVNKFASTLNFIGGTMRGLKADAEGTGNILTKTLFAGTIDKKGLDRLKERRKDLTTKIGKTKSAKEEQEKLMKDSSLSQLDRDAAKEQFEYLKGIEKELREERKKGDAKIRKQGNFLAKKIAESPFGKAGIALNENLTKKMEAVNNYLDDLDENGNIFQKGFAKISKVIISVGRFIFMASMYLLLFSLGFIVITKFFKSNADKFKKFFDEVSPVFNFLINTVGGAIMSALEGLMAIMSGIFEGDVEKIFAGVLDVLGGLFIALIGIAGTLLAGAISLIVSVAYVLWENLEGWIFSSEKGIKSKIGDLIILAATIASLLFIISLLPIQLPFILVAALGYVIFKAVKKIIKAIPGFAEGGVSTGGLAVVGERGPELVNLPKGSRVHSNADSRKMTGSTVNNINITINARDSSKAEMRRMADEIGRMISSKINRSTSSSTLR